MLKKPFTVDAVVILPDHIHCIWTLPEGDDDFSTRWKLLKGYFSKGMNTPLKHEGTKAVWQPRFWEHLIRDETDMNRHLDYIHYNPVKHGYAQSPGDYGFSSFARHVRCGRYHQDWGKTVPESVEGLEIE